jgi:D-alanyl-D-alanine carboxypeptidase
MLEAVPGVIGGHSSAPGTMHASVKDLGGSVNLGRLPRRRTGTDIGLMIAASIIVVIVLAAQASAETPSPLPEPSTSTAGVPSEPTASRSSATSSVDNTSSSTEGEVAGKAAGSLSLSVQSADGALPGRFFQDIGSYRFRGEAAELEDGRTVQIYRHGTSSGWSLQATTRLDGGGYSASLPVRERGTFTFAATTGGVPGSGDAITSNEVTITVEDSKIKLNEPVAKIDSLKNPTISGTVVPARGSVEVHIEVERSGTFREAATTTTDSSGHFSLSFSYGEGSLATYKIRATYKAANRDRWEVSNSETFTRIAVINAVITQTTAAEVEKTYHAGCPVGPSKLRTVRMNFYGRDKKMHRGLLIVRSGLTTEVIRSFNTSLQHRFRVAKMKNPNVYDGNDPIQMEANNTSAFNCRQVVGNPYKLSPHSYGTSIDVNPVQNPYRDIHGKWWPENGTAYIDRTPYRAGMLTKNSYLTQKLRSYAFFWGGLWSPGRDYQHFEYRG